MRLAVLLFVPALVFGQVVPKNINATVKKIVDEVSEQNIIATLKKLEGFETRITFSATARRESGSTISSADTVQSRRFTTTVTR